MTRRRVLIDMPEEQVAVLLALFAVQPGKTKPVTVEMLRLSGLFPTMKATAIAAHLRGLEASGFVETGWTWKTNSQHRQERCHTYSLTPAGRRRAAWSFAGAVV